MIRPVRRRLAEMTCRILRGTLPPRMRSWGQAVEAEVTGIPDDGRALLFALGSLAGLMPRALAFHLVRACDALTGSNTLSGGMSDMSFLDAAREPRSIGIACAIGAVMLGLAYMAAAGAPWAHLGINSAALLIGLLMIGILKMVGAGRVWTARYWPGLLTMVLAAALLATALLGVRVDGAARWVSLGGLAIQPSLILLPVMMLAFARSRDALSTAGMVVTAAALALQPDRAMAGMLTAGLTTLAVMRPDRAALTALAAGVAGFIVSLARSDLLPPTPYVDQVLYSSFGVHALAGLAVLIGLALLVLPAIVGVRHDLSSRHVHLVFGALWVSAVAAAALGNYPTPVVGYGGSFILGYFLSLTALPRLSCSAGAQAMPDQPNDVRPLDRRLRVGLARS
jgi:hypothetical protein